MNTTPFKEGDEVIVTSQQQGYGHSSGDWIGRTGAIDRISINGSHGTIHHISFKDGNHQWFVTSELELSCKYKPNPAFPLFS